MSGKSELRHVFVAVSVGTLPGILHFKFVRTFLTKLYFLFAIRRCVADRIGTAWLADLIMVVCNCFVKYLAWALLSALRLRACSWSEAYEWRHGTKLVNFETETRRAFVRTGVMTCIVD